MKKYIINIIIMIAPFMVAVILYQNISRSNQKIVSENITAKNAHEISRLKLQLNQLAKENKELNDELKTQRELIDQLSTEVSELGKDKQTFFFHQDPL